MNTKQKICLWMGLGFIDLVGLLTLYGRVVSKGYNSYSGRGFTRFTWHATDFLILLILIALTTFTVFLQFKNEKPKDVQKNNRSNSINLRKGFRRIIFVLSLITALIMATLCFVDIFDIWTSNCEQHEKYKKDHENIATFWFYWDTGRWEGGNREIVRLLLENDYDYSTTAFAFDDNTVYFYASEIFPGINDDMLTMPSSILEKKAQTAKGEAIRVMEGRVQQYEWWGEKPLYKVIFLAVLAALGGAAIGYLACWIVFGAMSWVVVPSISKFIRWLALGFRDDMAGRVDDVERT